MNTILTTQIAKLLEQYEKCDIEINLFTREYIIKIAENKYIITPHEFKELLKNFLSRDMIIKLENLIYNSIQNNKNKISTQYILKNKKIIDFNLKINFLIDVPASIAGNIVINEIKEIHQKENESINNISNKKMEYTVIRDNAHNSFNKHFSNEKNDNENFWLMYFELNNFSLINDIYGHDIGEKLINKVQNEIEKYIPNNWLLSRIGGDEYLIITNNCTFQEIENRLYSVFKRFNSPFHLEKRLIVYTTCSIGIVKYPENGITFEELFKNAELAMLKAKQKSKLVGDSFFELYTPQLTFDTIKRVECEKNIRLAIDNDQFIMFYQPKISTITKNIVGFEALIRWNNGENRFISPSDFIPIAEETGLIINLGYKSIEMVCKDINNWVQKGYNILPISINLSSKQFLDANFLNKLYEICDIYKINYNLINIEITERTMIYNIEKTRQILNKLREKGVKIIIDDFGKEYSSLFILTELPIDEIKIDNIFISQIEYDEKKIIVLKTIISMANQLGIKVTVEGVENKKQFEIVKELQADFVQGFLFSQPVFPSEVEKILKNNTE
ncbi:putative bifunctional diguanylate cyclase/phosphodiesterase [Caldicellulosiruptoraceae bacterium PP1]